MTREEIMREIRKVGTPVIVHWDDAYRDDEDDETPDEELPRYPAMTIGFQRDGADPLKGLVMDVWFEADGTPQCKSRQRVNGGMLRAITVLEPVSSTPYKVHVEPGEKINLKASARRKKEVASEQA